jgi:hypothetical protein
MKDGAVQLGDIADKITMLKVACSRCECRGRHPFTNSKSEIPKTRGRIY